MDQNVPGVRLLEALKQDEIETIFAAGGLMPSEIEAFRGILELASGHPDGWRALELVGAIKPLLSSRIMWCLTAVGERYARALEERRKGAEEQLLAQSISTLEIGAATRDLLLDAGFATIGAVAACPEARFRNDRRFGSAGAADIKQALSSVGLSFAKL